MSSKARSFLRTLVPRLPHSVCCLVFVTVGREELVLAPSPQEDAETLVVKELGLSEQTVFWVVTWGLTLLMLVET